MNYWPSINCLRHTADIRDTKFMNRALSVPPIIPACQQVTRGDGPLKAFYFIQSLYVASQLQDRIASFITLTVIGIFPTAVIKIIHKDQYLFSPCSIPALQSLHFIFSGADTFTSRLHCVNNEK